MSSDNLLSKIVCRKELLESPLVVVGVSGGSDSVALLLSLCELYGEDKTSKIIAVHVNHMLRGKNADRDEDFVRSICDELGIRLRIHSVDIRRLASKSGRTLEEEGRVQRYIAFDKEGALLSDKYLIATAHHGEDKAETMLMNLFRGSGIEGLTSLRERRENIIRPLINLRKSELISYIKAKGFSYITDETNASLDATRNIWRNKILPSINEINGRDPIEALNEAATLLSDDSEFITNLVEDLWEQSVIKIDSNYYLKTSVLKENHRAISSRLLRMLWEKSFGDKINLEKKHIVLMLKALDGGNTKLNMPFGRVFTLYGDIVFFSQGEDDSLGLISYLSRRGILFLNDNSDPLVITPGFNNSLYDSDIIVTLNNIENESLLEYNNVSWFLPVHEEERMLIIECGNLALPFSKAGNHITRSLGRVLEDNKIPSRIRRRVLYVRDNEKVLFIPGIGRAEGYQTLEHMNKAMSQEGYQKPRSYYKMEIKKDH